MISFVYQYHFKWCNFSYWLHVNVQYCYGIPLECEEDGRRQGSEVGYVVSTFGHLQLRGANNFRQVLTVEKDLRQI